MTESTGNIGSLPPIGSSQIGIDPSLRNEKKSDISLFDNAPNDVSFSSFFGKVVIGGIIGLCVAALLLGALSILGEITNSEDGSVNSLLWVILPVIGFVVGLVGNVALAGMYNLFFSKRYYNFGKMFGLIFASSLIILLFFFLIYLLFMDSIILLYTILGFQIIFELFVSVNLIDFLSQPNYSASSLIGNTFGGVLSVIAFLGITQAAGGGASELIIPIMISTVVAYGVMIFGAGIWDAIYYKFYEWGNNPFYLPSLNELREERQKEEIKKAKEEEDVNVELK